MIDNIKIDETKICLSAYRKKQEFEVQFKSKQIECLNFFQQIEEDEFRISIVN